MHDAAMLYVSTFRTDDKVSVIEFGSRNINGSPRWLFPNAAYTGVDIDDGLGVDVVVDAAKYRPAHLADVVICAEVFEHTQSWRKIVNNAARCLKVGGRVVVTAAGPGREPHSAVDGAAVREWEWYENVDPAKLGAALKRAGFVDVDVRTVGPDVQATGVKAGA
jgi:hypothetical protein